MTDLGRQTTPGCYVNGGHDNEPGDTCANCGEPKFAGRETTRWEGIVEVCKTCDRKAVWPFCEHRDEVRPEGDSWYRLVHVREVGHGR